MFEQNFISSMVFCLVVAFFSMLCFTPLLIKLVNRFKMGQIVRDDGPQSHLKKIGTPSMGGVAIILSIVISSLVFISCFTSLDAPVVVGLLVLVSFSILGFIDDYLKVAKKNTKGVSGKCKLLVQAIFSTAVALFLMQHLGENALQIWLPGTDVTFYLNPVLYVIFVNLVMVGSSNATNLTDGLDGLLASQMLIVVTSVFVFLWVVCFTSFVDHSFLKVVAQKNTTLFYMLSACFGALLAFFWFNCHPAKIFMGDVGSLSLGAILAYIVLLFKIELLLIVMGFVFVVEALSVIVQVVSYKIRRKRVFKMAPIHHHFELSGWKETQVVPRFAIVTILMCLISCCLLFS